MPVPVLPAHARIVRRAHTPSVKVLGPLPSAPTARPARTRLCLVQTTKTTVNRARRVPTLSLKDAVRGATASIVRRANIHPPWAPHQGPGAWTAGPAPTPFYLVRHHHSPAKTVVRGPSLPCLALMRLPIVRRAQGASGRAERAPIRPPIVGIALQGNTRSN